MGWYREIFCRFRRLPTPLLVLVVLGRFLFGFGLGALLASSLRANWRLFGWIALGVGMGVAVPGAVKILKG